LPFDRVSDGHAAWMALFGHFEGDSYRNCNVEDVYFTFEKFVEKHNEAFLELSRYGEPVLETKKVRDFLTRINAPELAAAKQQQSSRLELLLPYWQIFRRLQILLL
jgi:hypothetical protein